MLLSWYSSAATDIVSVGTVLPPLTTRRSARAVAARRQDGRVYERLLRHPAPRPHTAARKRALDGRRTDPGAEHGRERAANQGTNTSADQGARPRGIGLRACGRGCAPVF